MLVTGRNPNLSEKPFSNDNLSQLAVGGFACTVVEHSDAHGAAQHLAVPLQVGYPERLMIMADALDQKRFGFRFAGIEELVLTFWRYFWLVFVAQIADLSQ